MAQQSATSENSAIHLSELLLRLEGDYELLQELFDVFSQHAPLLLFQLKAAMGSQDLEIVQLRSHTLAGMLATLSCTEGRASAARMGRLAAERNCYELTDEVVHLERELSRAYAALEGACMESVG